MNWETFKETCQEKGIILSDTQLKLFEEYSNLLQEWNQKFNLTSNAEEEEILEYHFLDCLLPLSLIKDVKSCVDVGSGAGFPGMVWKIMLPDVEMILLEATGKKCEFLKEVIKEVKLEKIEVVNERAEEYVKEHREEYDLVVARAVAPLSILSELCVPLIHEGGYFLAMKGKHAEEERKEAKHAEEILGIKILHEQKEELPRGGERNNLLYIKEKKTAEKYPRSYGQMKKKPL